MKRAARHSTSDASIVDALENLRDELAVVRQVLDEILDELQWANRNRTDTDNCAVLVRRITSMPLDPCAPDWAERLNRFSPADLPADDPDAPSAEPGRLF